MTRSLERAFAAAARLPETAQDELAEAILAEIQAEERFDGTLEASREALERLADEAVAEHRGSKTEPMDTPDRQDP
jgi:hypothetical protein